MPNTPLTTLEEQQAVRLAAIVRAIEEQGCGLVRVTVGVVHCDRDRFFEFCAAPTTHPELKLSLLLIPEAQIFNSPYDNPCRDTGKVYQELRTVMVASRACRLHNLELEARSWAANLYSGAATCVLRIYSETAAMAIFENARGLGIAKALKVYGFGTTDLNGREWLMRELKLTFDGLAAKTFFEGQAMPAMFRLTVTGGDDAPADEWQEIVISDSGVWHIICANRTSFYGQLDPIA